MTKERKSVDKRLDIWFHEQSNNDFPATREADYKNRYSRISEWLTNNIHTQVERQAILSQIAQGTPSYDQIIYLSNHGPGHIQHVIDRATDLLQTTECKITPYEAYLLLVAIHLHDVGNVFGRENHERKSSRIMQDLGALAGGDEPEKHVILRIAAAHGGNLDGDRDTIGKLPPITDLLNKQIREQLLAALLRFSDELADDRTRADRYSLCADRIPRQSQLYHAYSASLHSVIVNESEVHLTYEFDKDTALKKYYKGDDEVFLFDEILNRALKMHLERFYCMRFLRLQSISLCNCIRCEVNIYNNFSSSRFNEKLKNVNFILEEKGYPIAPIGGIVSLCPDLDGTNGQTILEELQRG